MPYMLSHFVKSSYQDSDSVLDSVKGVVMGGAGGGSCPLNNWENLGERGQNRAKTYVLPPQ